jgi:hypothetical protein
MLRNLNRDFQVELSKLWKDVYNADRVPQHDWYGKEIGGFFTTEDGVLKSLVVLGIGHSDGKGETFVHPCCRDYVFHMHPPDKMFSDLPPSGADLVGTLAWGGPANVDENPDGDYSTKEEIVVTEAGIWVYSKSPELKDFYDSLLVSLGGEQSQGEEDSPDLYDRNGQEDLFEVLEWYAVYLIGLYTNGHIDRAKMIASLHTLDIPKMVSYAQRNVQFTEYIQKQMDIAHEEVMTLQEVLEALERNPKFSTLSHGFDILFMEHPFIPEPEVEKEIRYAVSTLKK